MSIVAGKARTAHLVLACVLAPPTTDAQRRRRLGSHRVDPFESRVRNVGPGLQELVLRAGDTGAAGEGVADRHDKIEMEGQSVRRAPGVLFGEWEGYASDGEAYKPGGCNWGLNNAVAMEFLAGKWIENARYVEVKYSENRQSRFYKKVQRRKYKQETPRGSERAMPRPLQQEGGAEGHKTPKRGPLVGRTGPPSLKFRTASPWH